MTEQILDTKPFSIFYNGNTLQVSVHVVGQNTLYFVQFPDSTLSLKLFRAHGIAQKHFWTSIPEDVKRVKETEAIGALIFEHYNP
jgi:hypothetical protein